MRKDTETTKEFLHLISNHLSSRKECKRMTYKVTIFENKNPTMDPVIEVFPSIHRRKIQDKTAVINHILQDHNIDVSDLVPGVYIYQISVNAKRRRWTNFR